MAGPLWKTLALPWANYIIWGSNTNVGKTIVAAALARAAKRRGIPFIYIKPVQTGLTSVDDADGYIVANACDARHHFSAHCLEALDHPSKEKYMMESENGVLSQDGKLEKGQNGTHSSYIGTLFGWQDAVSPHLAVLKEGRRVDDMDILQAIHKTYSAFQESAGVSENGLALIEIAGGPLSPSPNGRPFADLLKALNFPGLLVGSGKLGGITTTLSALESLEVRGYDVPKVLMMEDINEDSSLQNSGAIQDLVKPGIHVHNIQPIVDSMDDPGTKLSKWFSNVDGEFDSVLDGLLREHKDRISRTEDYRKSALQHFWYPFTQHLNVREDQVSIIDSRIGEYFSVFEPSNGCISRQFDACASWWTQGMDLERQIQMGREVGYAASKYGHCIFPTNVHQPALQCAQNMLQGPGSGWATRVFFSDNGSTSVEVALKMAFRKYLMGKYGKDIFNENEMTHQKAMSDLCVLSQNSAYHGDTLAPMNAVEPGIFNGPVQFPWNTIKSVNIQPSYVKHCNGEWSITFSENAQKASFASLECLFSKDRIESQMHIYYRATINTFLDNAPNVGALLLEPVLQGAGGMLLVDPLWQHALVYACRERGIPVIFDEVFVGIWRLGIESTANVLHINPDIACYAKLLTGGTIPMAVTLANEEVFEAFLDESKSNALLHGHSYTASPIACAASNLAFKNYNDHFQGENGSDFKYVNHYWDRERVKELSFEKYLKSAISLGTVLFLEFHDDDQGYSSEILSGIIKDLRQQGIYCRPLGNVLYFMCTPFTKKLECDHMLDTLDLCLQKNFNC